MSKKILVVDDEKLIVKGGRLRIRWRGSAGMREEMRV